MGAAVIIHLCIQRSETHIPALLAVIISQIDVSCVVPIDHTHLCFLAEIIAASVPCLGNLGAVAVLIPQVVVPIPGRPWLIDPVAVPVFCKFI